MGYRWSGTARLKALVVERFESRRSLDDILSGRDNNFDLLRIVAALSVMWGHSYFESPDDYRYGLFQSFIELAFNVGSYAVYGFFFISGMLISRSLEKHRSLVGFVIARFARLWPGYVACVCFVLYVLIPLTLGRGSLVDGTYLRAARTCVQTNMLFFVRGVCGAVAGAFPASPMPNFFGFTYWTLAAEVHCYAVVLLLGLSMGRRTTGTPLRIFLYCSATLATASLFLLYAPHVKEGAPFYPEFSVLGGYATYPVLFFLIGMIAYAVRRWIVVDGWLAILSLSLALVLPSWTQAILPAFAYGLLALAGAPQLRRLQPKHDLSYGVYIYGLAIQQAVVGLTGSWPVPVNFLASAPIALGIAFLSWRFIEAPSIALGRALTRRIEGHGRGQPGRAMWRRPSWGRDLAGKTGMKPRR